MALSKRYYSVNGEMLYEKGVSRVDYLPDALGSITATTVPGLPNAVENTYRMKPYGSTLVKTGTGADPSFRWLGTVGYRRTNLFRPGIYVRARHYSQEDGRWTTVDPTWPFSMQYAYVSNRPTAYLDPMGTQAIPPTPPPHPGCPVDCTPASNACIYNYCNNCYRNPWPGCTILCSYMAGAYYKNCHKPPTIDPMPIFAPPPGGGVVAPRPNRGGGLTFPGMAPSTPCLSKPSGSHYNGPRPGKGGSTEGCAESNLWQVENGLMSEIGFWGRCIACCETFYPAGLGMAGVYSSQCEEACKEAAKKLGGVPEYFEEGEKFPHVPGE